MIFPRRTVRIALRPAVVAACLTGSGLVAGLSQSAGFQLPWLETQKVVPADPRGGVFAFSVSLDGEVAIAGASGADIDGNIDQGEAFVFRRTEGTWVQEQRLEASDGSAGDRFGRAVAIDGNTVVVGAYLAAVNGSNHQGAIYVFERIGGVWVELQKLTASDGAKQDRLGNPVALYADTLMAAASGADVGGAPSQGAVYVFTRESGAWSEHQKLIVKEGGASDLLGLTGLTIRGDCALVGAQSVEIDGVDRGAAYFFERSGETWSEGQRLTASDGSLGDRFGSSVAFDDRTVVIGADQADIDGASNQGAAYVFALENGVWVERQKLVAFDGDAFYGYGKAVAVEGGRVLVGGEFDEPGRQAVGAVYSYRLDGASWSLDQKLVASDSVALDNFGDSLALEGDALLVGASSAPPFGAMYVFHHNPLFADGFETGDTSAWSTTVP